MNFIINRFKIVFSATLLTIFVSVPVTAEDLEIYKSTNVGSNAVQPNILFILDTSGSMDDDIDDVEPLYDPERDYSADSGCNRFVSTEVYFLPNGDSLTDVSCSSTYSNNNVTIAQNKCDALDYALHGLRNADDTFLLDAYGNIQGAGGFIQDRFTQWTGNPGNTWDNPDPSPQDSKYLECLSDEGEHGIDAASADKWIDIASGTEYSSVDTNVAWSDSMSTNSLFYSANYAHFRVFVSDPANAESVKKIDIMRSTIISIMDGGVSNVDVGLMKFNDDGGWSTGGTVMHPVIDIKLPRNDLFATMKTWDATGGTPLTEAMYEGMRYFAGSTPLYGGLGGDAVEGSTTLTDSGTQYYKSPVDADAADCERQFIILLSDGEPGGDTASNDAIRALPDFNSISGTADVCDGFGYDVVWGVPVANQWNFIKDNGNENGLCLDDFTKHLATEGIDVALSDGSQAGAFTGTTETGVRISTYTVGLDINSELLEDAGIEGAGPEGYQIANSASDLLQTLVDIIEEIKGIDTTFASPAVSVNAFNRTTNRNDLYFTLFKPSSDPHWDGNFKRFKLTFDDQGVPEIVDVNDNPAIDANTGFFADTAQSYWTAAVDAPDGSNTEQGGVASKLFTGSSLSTSRKIYSNLNTASALTSSLNRVEENNANLTDALMGVTGAEKTKLIQWAQGFDVDGADVTASRRQMGDPLHSQPALIEYGDGNTDQPEIVAYVATNDGYLHAFDTRTTATTNGIEKFAFIPKELLPNLNTLYINTNSTKQYGLDGSVASYIKDVDSDGEIEAGDRVIIYVGMRRGGNNYYALDVTNPDAPTYLWTIYGGQDNAFNGGLGDYTELAQSWSTPQVKKIRLNGADVPVLIFAAGYDNDQDDVLSRAADDEGRGIFIVNALSGNLLWRMGPDLNADLQDANMIYSIPSDIAAADASGDGYVDHLYVGDMGGQLWRVDIDNNLGESEADIDNIIAGGRIADLADASSATNRKFFYPPDVAILKDDSDIPYISVLITSGNRAHPLEKIVQNRAFMLRDLPISGKPATYTTVTVNDTDEELFDTTNNLIGQGTDIQKTAALSSLQTSNGWFFDFDASVGEKGLTKPLIFFGEAFFATYVPVDTDEVSERCGPDEGTGFLYHINLENATPVKNYDNIISNDVDALTAEDRKKTLVRSGIPAAPTLVIPSDGAAVCVGTECDQAEGIETHKRVYWFEE